MSFNKGKQLKQPHSAADFLGFEDRLSKIAQEFREIREAMRTHGRETVGLKSGTFDHHLKEIESLIKRLRGEAESQLARPAARALSASLPENPKRTAKKH